MQAILTFVGLIALVWGIWKLNEPWRKYHEEHIAPLEKELAAARAQRDAAESARNAASADARLFTRNFPAEVRRHQNAKRAGYDDLGPLRERKSDLHDEMNDVRSDLDRWHRGARGVFGNKGRKIKNDSVLGWFGLEQTMAQKAGLESRRAAVSSEIGELKDEMSEIYERRIKPAKDGIAAAFNDQKRLARFRREGLDERHFRHQIRVLEARIADLSAEIARLEAMIRDTTAAYRRKKTA